MHTFPLFRSMRWYAYHACLCPHWLCLHLYTLAYMFMHESCLLVCRPCFNTMKSWTFGLNLHLSLADPFVLLFVRPFCLFVCYLACLPTRLFAQILIVVLAVSILLVHFTSFCYYLHILLPSLICWFSCLCLFMYTHGARTHGAKVWSPGRKQKGQGHEQVVGPSDCSQ